MNALDRVSTYYILSLSILFPPTDLLLFLPAFVRFYTYFVAIPMFSVETRTILTIEKHLVIF